MRVLTQGGVQRGVQGDVQRRCSKEVFKGDVQRGCSKEVFIFYRVEKRGVLKL